MATPEAGTTIRLIKSMGKLARVNSATNPATAEKICLLKMEKALLLSRSESTNEAERTMVNPNATMKMIVPTRR
jgi:hypothetical protein